MVPNGRGLLHRGLTLLQMGNEQEAKLAFAASIKINPKNQDEIDMDRKQ